MVDTRSPCGGSYLLPPWEPKAAPIVGRGGRCHHMGNMCQAMFHMEAAAQVGPQLLTEADIAEMADVALWFAEWDHLRHAWRQAKDDFTTPKK